MEYVLYSGSHVISIVVAAYPVHSVCSTEMLPWSTTVARLPAPRREVGYQGYLNGPDITPRNRGLRHIGTYANNNMVRVSQELPILGVISSPFRDNLGKPKQAPPLVLRAFRWNLFRCASPSGCREIMVSPT